MREKALHLEPAVVDAVANENMKNIAGMGAHTMGLAMQNAVTNQQAMNMLGVAALGSTILRFSELGVEEGGVMAAVMQQIIKGAQTTPPVTAQTPATPG